MSDESELTAKASRRTGEALPGAQAAFVQLYELHARSLVAYLASRVAKSDLDDVHQTIWARVWQALPERFTGGHFRGWLFQIARNYLIDRSRRRHDDPTDFEVHPEMMNSPDANLLAVEEQMILKRCLEKLPAEQKEIVRGRLAGEDYETIGPRMKLPTTRLHKLFFEAKSQLQNCVQQGA